MKKYRILFMGTTDYAAVCLERLYSYGYDIPLVVTQPDRPKGRGKKIIAPPAKMKALELNLDVDQPEKIRRQDFYCKLEDLGLDLIVTAAYGKILSPKLLNIPEKGVLNVHASLLPELRGAAPVHWAIIRGFKETGVTIMKTDPGMDTGPVLAQKRIKIEEDDTAGSLEGKLASLGANLLVDTIPGYMEDIIKPRPQDNDRATYAPKLRKEDALINWKQSAENICNLVRGTNPAPGAYTYYDNLLIKIHKTNVLKDENLPHGEPGEITAVIKSKGLVVQTGDYPLLCINVQPASRKPIRGDQLVAGRYVEIGRRFNLGRIKEN